MPTTRKLPLFNSRSNSPSHDHHHLSPPSSALCFLLTRLRRHLRLVLTALLLGTTLIALCARWYTHFGGRLAVRITLRDWGWTKSLPPLFENIREFELGLPQHNPNLPLPEGGEGKYFWASNHVHGMCANYDGINSLSLIVCIFTRLGIWKRTPRNSPQRPFGPRCWIRVRAAKSIVITLTLTPSLFAQLCIR